MLGVPVIPGNTADCKSCNTQVEEWKTTFHMNLIIFQPQHALPLRSNTINQLWFSTVQLACLWTSLWWFIIVGRAWASSNLICHCTKQNLWVNSYVSHMPTARTATISVDTYAWTELYTQVMSWISGVYVSFMHGPYLAQRDRHPVGSLPLMICSS